MFIDGQTDFYGEKLSKDYLRIRQLAPDCMELLEEYEVSWILTPQGVPLVQGLTLDPRWKRVYSDDVAIVFSRKGRS